MAHYESVIDSSPKVIVVLKGQRRLTLLKNGQAAISFPVTLGRNPEGAKEQRDDWRTPEGVYYVARKNPASKYYLALHLSYPNKEDADRGLGLGLISPAQHDQIYEAVGKGSMPPQDTALGSYVEIHGRSNRLEPGPDGEPRLRGWTRGCVGLRDGDIAAIYQWTPVGTPVLLIP
jgi:murein L,D-transpeptidase YafK